MVSVILYPCICVCEFAICLGVVVIVLYGVV